MQYRIKSSPCKRRDRQKVKHKKGCYPDRFTQKNQETETIEESKEALWGVKYDRLVNASLIARYGDFYYGMFGDYSPFNGYKIDFYPYDMT